MLTLREWKECGVGQLLADELHMKLKRRMLQL